MSETLKPKQPKRDYKQSVSKGKNSQKGIEPSNDNKQSKSAIPKDVANRMARRIVITTGLPTFCGMAVFVVSYLLVSKGIADIPPALTLLTSAACFLTGLLGLSYGILSASWENKTGSLFGLENIRPNIARVKDAFRALNDKK